MPDDVNSPPSAANPQIIDAVGRSTGFVFGPNAGAAPTANAGTAIAYQKVAQAAALAVQDGTDYQRNILSLSTVAQGKALAMMFAEKSVSPYAEILLLAMLAAIGATITVGQIDSAATTAASTFPKS